MELIGKNKANSLAKAIILPTALNKGTSVRDMTLHDDPGIPHIGFKTEILFRLFFVLPFSCPDELPVVSMCQQPIRFGRPIPHIASCLRDNADTNTHGNS